MHYWNYLNLLIHKYIMKCFDMKLCLSLLRKIILYKQLCAVCCRSIKFFKCDVREQSSNLPGGEGGEDPENLIGNVKKTLQTPLGGQNKASPPPPLMVKKYLQSPLGILNDCSLGSGQLIRPGRGGESVLNIWLAT